MLKSQYVLPFLFLEASWNVVEAQPESCTAFNISKGETLVTDCERVCATGAGTLVETFDWATASDADPNIIDGHTVCRCTLEAAAAASTTDEGEAAEDTIEFECLEIDENVWDKSVGVKLCEEDYNITSGSQCKEFCMDIAPYAFAFSGRGGNIDCACGGDIQICTKSRGTRRHSTVLIVQLVPIVLIVVSLSGFGHAFL